MTLDIFKKSRDASKTLYTICKHAKMKQSAPPQILQPVQECTLEFMKTDVLLWDDSVLHSKTLFKTCTIMNLLVGI